MRKKVLALLWLIGIVLFVFIIQKIGLKQIADNISKLSWQHFAILVFLRLVFWISRSLNWMIVHEQYGEKVPFREIFVARLSGHAISYLTPSAHLGGEAARAMMLSSANRKKAVASVIVDKTIEIMVTVLFAFIGIGLAIFHLNIPRDFKIVFIIFMIFSVPLLYGVFRGQRRGLFTLILNALNKIKIRFKFLEKNRDKIRQTDAYISYFYGHHPRIFLGVTFLYGLSILLWISEIYMNLVFLGCPAITMKDSFFIITLGTVAFLLPTVPASIGTYEVTYLVIFAILGLPVNLGITLTLIRRILALIWALIGLLAMTIFKKKKN